MDVFEYGLSRSCSGIKMFLIRFLALSLLLGEKKVLKKNPELGGTLASNHQAANLSD